ncbi:hypothetical protein [Nocardioides sp. T2.26MG-1]|uniref:hypothetical protein n=1 Tax=Nocardioides sp. T2.26MG-1 TaxID=3041166 RepID=UPI0024775836|nr:hypothetical protein [Nocardioides sp. T2.26MG-1]CAI9400623.1 hypothetical protein HIDPHFAB_00441 [Nocardioides sp. T2.26MG-1]
MLTDDDLTRQLGAAFRGATDDLEYAGRVPTPRRPAYVLALPAAATVATAAALVVAGAGTPHDTPHPPAAVTSPSTSPSTRVVTDRVEVAGFTFSYRHVAGDARVDDLYGVMHPGAVPEDARPIEAPEGVHAWVGTYAATGDNALFVEAPTRNGGDLFAIASPTWTPDELVDLFHNGSPS